MTIEMVTLSTLISSFSAEKPITNPGHAKLKNLPSEQGSTKSRAALRKFKAENPIQFDPELAKLIYESQNNTIGSPAIHYAIETLRRPDVAIALIKLFPETVNEEGLKHPFFQERGTEVDSYLAGYDPGDSALKLAIQNGYEEVVRSLLEAGANPNWISIKHRSYSNQVTEISLLGFAIEQKQQKIAEMLLEHGASQVCVLKQSKALGINMPLQNLNALMMAKMHFPEDNDFVKRLIEQGIREKNKPAQTITQSDIDLVLKYTSEAFVGHGPWPALHHAFQAKDFEAAQRLVELGADLEWNPDPLNMMDIIEGKDKSPYRPRALDEIVWDNSDNRFLLLLIQEGYNTEKIFTRCLEENRTQLFQDLIKSNINPELYIQHAAKCDIPELISSTLNEELMTESFLCDKPKLLQFLLSQGVKFDNKMLFDLAVNVNCLPVVRLILEKDADFPRSWVLDGMKKALEMEQTELYSFLFEQFK